MALTKTVQVTDLFPIAVVSQNTVVASAAFSCPTNFTATFYIDYSPIDTQATPKATEWRIESSEVDGLNLWTAVYSRLTLDVVPDNPNVTVATAGTNAITASAGTNFVNGVYAFFKNATLGNSEWGYVTDLSGNTFHILDNLQFTQTGTNNVWNQGEKVTISLPLNATRRYRFVVNNNRDTGGTLNRDMVFKCSHTTLDQVT